jgi:NosR/NirI family nitrous oxide reductase transcriptional regulator
MVRSKQCLSACFLALILCLLPLVKVCAGGLNISPIKPALPEIQQAFPNASKISDKQGEFLVRTIYGAAFNNGSASEIIAYAFETNDIARVPAYSGEPVNTLVIINPAGVITHSIVLEHHEPILLVGIPAQKLFDFANEYVGLNADDRVKIGGRNQQGNDDGYIHIDAVSGATVTIMVVNVAIMRSAKKVAHSLGIIEVNEAVKQLPSSVKSDYFNKADWLSLTGDGSIRHLNLNNEQVDKAFIGTQAEQAASDEPESLFTEIYYTQLDIPTIGKNLLGESEYQWLMGQLKPGEHVIALMGNGYSFKGSGYVRGGIFDRILMHQGETEFTFRDTDHYRINDLFVDGVPHFSEMSLFIVRDHLEFDPGSDWQVELLVRRQTGPIESAFTSFKADYMPIESYIIRPPPVVVGEELALWQQVWQEKDATVMIVIFSMALLLLVIFFQDFLVKFPRQLHMFRQAFLVYTIFFIGFHFMGQLSIVNVLTFMQALMSDFYWETFLLDPVIFLLWCFVAFTVLLWGRGIYCGWLCPFGALQEVINEIALKLKIPQYVMPWAIHERLWAVKYMVLLALFGLSLESLATAETYAEIEPFKTTFLLGFDREWPFIIYAGFLIFISIFSRKVYCRYICPLGAAIAIPSGMRLFDWLKRRKECGNPCKVCANECEIGAIEPNGEINLRECHHCLDCQSTYYNQKKCPPLVNKHKKRSKHPVEVDAVKIIN